MGSLEVVLAPSVTMLLGSLAALRMRVPPKLQACTQNFSAGLLMSAVAGELYPLMSPAPPNELSGVQSVVTITCGFVLGLAFMFGLEHLTEGGGEDEEEDEGDHPRRVSSSNLGAGLLEGEAGRQAMQAFSSGVLPLLEEDVRQLEQAIAAKSRDDIDGVLHSAMFHVDKAVRCLKHKQPLDADNLLRMQFHLGELKGQGCELLAAADVQAARRALKDFQGTLDHIHSHAERCRFCRWKPQDMPLEADKLTLSERIPWSVVAAVTADGGVDGLLIGLAFAADPTAGWAMSIATCIEMGFLGLSFCAMLANATRKRAKIVLITMMPPLALVSAGIVGTRTGTLLQETPTVFVGFIAFSIVALLFLVTQELLAEAREVAEDSAVINSMIFVGLLGGILLSKLLG